MNRFDRMDDFGGMGIAITGGEPGGARATVCMTDVGLTRQR